MKTLSFYLSEAQDNLGHVVQVGDMIQFRANSMMLYGEVKEITDDERSKFVVKTLGWFGDESMRSKVKEQYRVNTASTSVYKLNLVKRQ